MKKTIWSVAIVLIMAVSLVVGCGSRSSNPTISDQTTVEPADDFHVWFDMGGSAAAYCLKFANSIEKYAAEEGLRVTITQSDLDAAKQVNTAETMMVQEISMAAGVWMDVDACLPIADMCREADIPIVSALTHLTDEGGGYNNYIYLGSQNFDGGYLQGEWLAKHLPEGANIWYMGSLPGDIQGQDRHDGLLAGLADNDRLDVEIVAFEYAQAAMDRGVEIMENWLQVYDRIDCVVGASDPEIIGAIEAAKAVGRMEGTIFVGLDGQDIALESIKAGEMSMSVLQDADGQAKEFIKLCEQIRDGADASALEDILVPFQIITPDNVDQFEW